MSRETDPYGALPLEVVVRQEGSAAVLELIGEFDLDSVDAAQAGLAELRTMDADEHVVDMARLTFIDSTGIAFLLTIIRSDGDTAVRFISSEATAVQRVLAITGVADMLVQHEQQHRR